jgi:hypothetical protein
MNFPLPPAGEVSMKAISGVLVVLVAVLLGPAPQPPAEKGKAKVPNYYPLKAGTKWHYQFTIGTGRKGLLLTQIAEVENIGGQDLARLETVVQGEVKSSEHLSSNDQGIFRHRQGGVPIDPAICLLKFPVKEGQEWKVETKFGEKAMTVTGREGRNEEVKVPAGTYQAVTSLVETNLDGMRVSTNFWFVPDVGIVKQTIDLGGRTIELELAKYEPGK